MHHTEIWLGQNCSVSRIRTTFFPSWVRYCAIWKHMPFYNVWWYMQRYVITIDVEEYRCERWPLCYTIFNNSLRRIRITDGDTNRRFPEITGKDNLTVFSYSGRVKFPQWRRQRRRADLRQFQIFRHGPIIIYTSLPAGGTYYPICMFPTNSERLIGISDAFSAFVYGYPSSCPRAQCTPNKSVPTLRYTRRHGPV